MELVVITGMSGAGRHTAAHAMEDLGWYVVDNLPPVMLPDLTEYLHNQGIDHLCVVLDVRSQGDLMRIPEMFEQMSDLVGSPHILFLEAGDAQIVRRQESSRRPVPLQGSGTLLQGIHAERQLMSTLRASADMVIDTSSLTGHQLSARVTAAFSHDDAEITLTVMSFGFKNGIPLDADMVVDVRFLPNPHWIPELRPHTGLSTVVSSYVLSFPEAESFLDQLQQLISTTTGGFINEGKRQILLGVGCTGGKHRSVAIAEELSSRLHSLGYSCSVIHRDLGRE